MYWLHLWSQHDRSYWDFFSMIDKEIFVFLYVDICACMGDMILKSVWFWNIDSRRNCWKKTRMRSLWWEPSWEYNAFLVMLSYLVSPDRYPSGDLSYICTPRQLSVWNFTLWWDSRRTAVPYRFIIFYGMTNAGLYRMCPTRLGL